VITVILFSMTQLAGNQFGFDRSGFRVFVLGPADRRDVLLGKNLAVAPLALALTIPGIVLLQMLYPMRLDYLLAVLPQFVSMYLLFCLITNVLSIIAPMPIASGTLKPVNPRVIPILLHMSVILFLPICTVPTLLPIGIQFVLESLEWDYGMPICLILSLVECVLVIFLYRLALTWQGRWLQAYELSILETVAAKAD
jgi:hypothetical protein